MDLNLLSLFILVALTLAAGTALAASALFGVSLKASALVGGVEVSETEFTAIKDIPEAQRALVLHLLSREPASHFFDITYPDALIARILAPKLQSLVQSSLP